MKNFKIAFLTLILFIIFSGVSYAHVLKTDGSIGAVIHVSPEDDPIAGESTDFFFEIKDKKGKFGPKSCDCKGIILQGDKEIYSAPLFQNNTDPSLENASFSFVFPEKNIYKVRVSGKPTKTGAFESFTLTWDIRVARESEVRTPVTDAGSTGSTRNKLGWMHIVGIVLILVSIAYFVKKKLSTKHSSDK